MSPGLPQQPSLLQLAEQAREHEVHARLTSCGARLDSLSALSPCDLRKHGQRVYDQDTLNYTKKLLSTYVTYAYM